MTPPVQPSQQPPSTTAKGVYWTAMLQRGRWRDLWEVMQTRGSCLSQVWSPSKGLQLLQENLPAQLELQLGQTVAWKVSPFLTGLRLNSLTFEIPPLSTALTEAVSNSTVSANLMAFINLSTNYYSKQKITADQYFPQHFQKNTRIDPARCLAHPPLGKFFQKTVLIKIIEHQTVAKRRNPQIDFLIRRASSGFWGHYSKAYAKQPSIKGVFRGYCMSLCLDSWFYCFVFDFSHQSSQNFKFKIKNGVLQISSSLQLVKQ